MKRSENGFTLIELVVVAVLIAGLSLVLYRATSGIVHARDVLDERRVAQRTAQYVLQRLERELQNRVDVPLTSKGRGSVGSLQGRGGKGSGGSGRIRFVSSGTGQMVIEGGTNYGSVEVEYRLDKGRDGNPALVREEIPAGAKTAERRIAFPVASNVSALNFRYREGGKWTKQWPATRRDAPEAIEISLEIRSEKGDRRLYRTAIAIARSRPAQ